MKRWSVAVGTESALKLRAVDAAFAKLKFEVDIKPCKVDSGVGAQPIGLPEMRMGVENRFRGAFAQFPNADFFIGIESGLVIENESWFDVICVAAVSKVSGVSYAYSSYTPVPSWLVDQIRSTKSELGFVIQKLAEWGEKDAQAYLSRDRFKREDQLEQALVAALLPHANVDRYMLPNALSKS